MIKNNAPNILPKALLDGVRVNIKGTTYCLDEDSGDIAIVGFSSVRGEIILATGMPFSWFLTLSAEMTEEELVGISAATSLRHLAEEKRR